MRGYICKHPTLQINDDGVCCDCGLKVRPLPTDSLVETVRTLIRGDWKLVIRNSQ